jgi:integrase/recombinase XerD
MPRQQQQRPLVIRRYGDIDLAQGMRVKGGVYGDIEVRASWRGRRVFKCFPLDAPLAERLMWQHQMMEQMRLGKDARSCQVGTSFAQDIDAYLESLEGDRQERARQWLSFWRQWYGHERRADLTLQQVQAFFQYVTTKDGHPFSASSKNKLRTYALNVWRYHDGRRHLCPCLDIPVFDEPKGETRELRPEDILRILDAMGDTANRARLGLMFVTGCRPIELSWLREDAFHLDEAVPFVSIRGAKGGASRMVPLPEMGVQFARDFLRLRGWQHQTNLYRDMQRAAARVGLEVDRGERHPGGRKKVLISPYALRHTYAMQLRRSGAGIDDIADALGHRSLETTRRYAQAIPERQVAVTSKMWERVGVR